MNLNRNLSSASINIESQSTNDSKELFSVEIEFELIPFDNNKDTIIMNALKIIFVIFFVLV